MMPYDFGPVHISECNHKVSGNTYEAMDGCEAIDSIIAKD